MPNVDDLFSARKSLDQICQVPESIISVYSLEKHVWADGNSEEARRQRRPELQTIAEFQIDPVRPFLTNILSRMAAPYKRERKENPIGQGYWVQAEFGSGKSHLLCFLAALALGSQEAWDLVREKEKAKNRGKRDSLYYLWEEGLQAKSSGNSRGILVIVKTLTGTGAGTIGTEAKGKRLTEYILDAAKEQLQLELGQNISLYPVELLADRFLKEDLERYRKELDRFLHDPRFFEPGEYQDVADLIRVIQSNQLPEYKRSAGNKLWRFYTEYLKVQPQIAAESEEVLKHLVETALSLGYAGVLIVLDEVSLFMKNRDDTQRADDEQTLVVLANRLAKVHNLPVWTVCSAQQRIESKLGEKNIIADDRLQLVKLLESDRDYYDIVLERVREIIDPAAISNYYLHYKRGFTWPSSIGEDEFRRFFPFHQQALEVLRAITFELTTARSAIHFMHQVLKHQVKHQGRELIRLWELFDEAVSYQEDPSGVNAGLAAIKTSREAEYRAYEEARRQIEGLTKGYLKVHREKACKALQTLFLYHVARTRQQGLTAEELANSVLIERDSQATPEENIQHYETLAENLHSELVQVQVTIAGEAGARYRFEPTVVGIDPKREFTKARDEAEANPAMQQEAWRHLLGFGEWLVRTRQMTLDLSYDVRSLFCEVAQQPADRATLWSTGAGVSRELVWQGRQVSGRVSMADVARMAQEGVPLPQIDSAETDEDFAVVISSRPASQEAVQKLLAQRADPRVLVWTPSELNEEERGRLLDFAAYRKLVSTFGGKDSDDAVTVINWVADALRGDMARIAHIVDDSYARGRVDALNNTNMAFQVAGGLDAILTPLVGRVLSSAYESHIIHFDPPFLFRKEEAVKVINGIVKTGSIPKGAKPNQDISAAQNFGYALLIMDRPAGRELDVSRNPFVADLLAFIDERSGGSEQAIKIDTIYKNFMGLGGPKDYGLSRRMVQVYLLALVRLGKVRLGVAPKAGLARDTIDHANVADIDFSAKVLDGLSYVQKLATPENWEALRPYAEKLLGRAIPSTHDDAMIAEARKELRDLFARRRSEAERLTQQCTHLFAALGAANPYAHELEQVARLYSHDLQQGNDIEQALYALKDAFGYRAFDEGVARAEEVDDLANRLANYADLERFSRYDRELRLAAAYRDLPLPEGRDLQALRRLQQQLADKLAHPQPYIDSEVRLTADLLGSPTAGHHGQGTLYALIGEYTSIYVAAHEQVADAVDRSRREIEALLASNDLRALRELERITVLQPPIAGTVEERLRAALRRLFTCPSPSVASVKAHLQHEPLHSCGLRLQQAGQLISNADEAVKAASASLDGALAAKLDTLLSPAIRERLAQGRDDEGIARLLACHTREELRAYLVPACLADPTLVERINRYLKRIVIRTVRLADFRPANPTIEAGQIGDVARQLESFLREHLPPEGDDILPMLRLE